MQNCIVIPGFEGSEKKLVIDFAGVGSMRTVPRVEIDAFLSAAKCTIISQTSTELFDSYVLSESSLFIYPHQVIVKTCGTTSLLYCLPKLLASGSKIGLFPEFVSFTRSNYKYPEVQPDVHKDFDSEVNYLNQYFCGEAYILGPLNGTRWHVYTAEVQLPSKIEYFPRHEQTFEVVMTHLEPAATARFFRLKSDPEALVYNAKKVTQESGIDKLIPNSIVDDFLFEPCGYSCNGVIDGTYFTIHVTPEDHCSFASFETNASLDDYNPLLKKVLEIFKPKTFCVSMFVDNGSKLGNSQKCIDWGCEGFVRTECSYNEFAASDCNISFGNFISVEVDPIELEMKVEEKYEFHEAKCDDIDPTPECYQCKREALFDERANAEDIAVIVD